MKIVHYTLGIYPQRTGGLNKYATDLMREQCNEHKVVALIPGAWKPWLKKCRISKWKEDGGIRCYRLINAMPLPLFYGIKKPKDFIKTSISNNSFEKFYENIKPDVIHLHTLMGLPEEALLFFKEKGVRIVYTSHDYFGICPKVNLINEKGVLCQGPNHERCASCNVTAPSSFFLRVRNSELFFLIRDFRRWLKNTIHF